jgi:hypothetical protein
MTIRDELQHEIEETRAAFHRLLADVPGSALTEPSDNPAWTVGEVLYHMSVAPALMVADVSLITEERRLAQAMLRHFPQGAT